MRVYEVYTGMRGQTRVGFVDEHGRVHHFDEEDLLSTPETDVQFLARMIMCTREGAQIPRDDADHLAHLANYGPGPYPMRTAQPPESTPVQGLIREG